MILELSNRLFFIDFENYENQLSSGGVIPTTTTTTKSNPYETPETSNIK